MLLVVALLSSSAVVGTSSGAAVMVAAVAETEVSISNTSVVALVLSLAVFAVGTLRFGPVSFKTAAWRDLRPNMPVLPANNIEGA